MKHKVSSRERVRQYIKDFWQTYHYPPTMREIANGLNYNSVDAVRYHIKALREAGVIEWQEGNERTIRMVTQGAKGG